MIKLTAVVPLLLVLLISACGGESTSGTGPQGPNYIPRFMDRWKGVNSDFQLWEFEFANPNDGASSGSFNVDDSSINVRDSTGESVAFFSFSGNFDQRDFNFTTRDNGTPVATFNGRFVEDDLIRVTPTSPAGDAFLVYLTDDSSFIPDIEDTWTDAQGSIRLEYNVPFTNTDVAAFFNGEWVDNSDGVVRALDGYYISSVVVMRYVDDDGNTVEVTGEFTDADTLSLSGGRSLTRN